MTKREFASISITMLNKYFMFMISCTCIIRENKEIISVNVSKAIENLKFQLNPLLYADP